MTTPYNTLYENPRMKLYRNMNMKVMQNMDVANLLKAAIVLLTVSPRGHAIHVDGSANLFTIALHPASRSMLWAVDESDQVATGTVDEIVASVCRSTGQIATIDLQNLITNKTYQLYTDGRPMWKNRAVNLNNSNNNSKKRRF